MDCTHLHSRQLANRSRSLDGRPLNLVPRAFASALVVLLLSVHTFAQTARTTTPKLTVAQKKVVRNFEKRLVTRFNSRDANPGDKYTWYVIVFTDTALGARKSRSVSGNIETTTFAWHAAQNSAVRIIQGRKNAAILLVQYCFYSGNAAAARLRPAANGLILRQGAFARKDWRYRAFASAEEARAFFEALNTKQEKNRGDGEYY